MTASRSRPKSPSNVTVEPRASADARDSESRRPGPGWVAARRTTAMARASESITTSSPARTRASRPAKSRTASASEMWTTAIVTMIPAVYSECHQYPRPHPPGRPGVQLENRLSQGDAMSDLAANPAVVPDPILHMMTRTNESLCPRSDGGGVRSSIGSWTSRMARANRAAMAANFFDQGADETLLRHVSAVLYPAFVSVTASGLVMRPAALGLLLRLHHPITQRSRAGDPGLRRPCGVTVPPGTSLQTRYEHRANFFRAPPRKQTFGAWEHGPSPGSAQCDPIQIGKFNKRRHDHVSKEQSQPHRLPRQ